MPYLVICEVEVGLQVGWHDDKPVDDGEADQQEPGRLELLGCEEGLGAAAVEADSERVPGQGPHPQRSQHQWQNEPDVSPHRGSRTRFSMFNFKA